MTAEELKAIEAQSKSFVDIGWAATVHALVAEVRVLQAKLTEAQKDVEGLRELYALEQKLRTDDQQYRNELDARLAEVTRLLARQTVPPRVREILSEAVSGSALSSVVVPLNYESKLAESQACEAELRSTLEQLFQVAYHVQADVEVAPDSRGAELRRCVDNAQFALARPADRSALDAMLAEARKAALEEAADSICDEWSLDVWDAHSDFTCHDIAEHVRALAAKETKR